MGGSRADRGAPAVALTMPVSFCLVGSLPLEVAMSSDAGAEHVNRLCRRCQRSCKQTDEVVVCECRLFVRVPVQRGLDLKADGSAAGRSSASGGSRSSAGVGR